MQEPRPADPSSVGGKPTPPSPQLLPRLQEEHPARWQRGEPQPVEALLAGHSTLRDDASALLDLVLNEVRCREGVGEWPTLDEYQRRFPQIAAPLAARFALHRALAADSQVNPS